MNNVIEHNVTRATYKYGQNYINGVTLHHALRESRGV